MEMGLFDGLSEKEKTEVIEQYFVTQEYCRTENIVYKHGNDRKVFYIVKGKVCVRVAKNKTVELGPGDTFGEIGFLTGRLRTASVIALTDVVVYSLDFVEIKKLLKTNTHVGFTLYSNCTCLMAEKQEQTNKIVDELTEALLDSEDKRYEAIVGSTLLQKIKNNLARPLF